MIIFWILYGLMVGLCVKMLTKKDPPGLFWAVGIGIIGSVIGGFLSSLIDLGLPNFMWAIAGGLIFCYIYGRFHENG